MKNNKTFKVVYSALFAALVFIGTQFIKIPLPFGYFNFGDCFVLLSAFLIGGSYAMAASAIGATLADILSGYTIYAPATLIIKSLMVLIVTGIIKFGNHNYKINQRILLSIAAVAAELIMVGGYFIYDSILYSFAGAATALAGNIMQGVFAVVTSMVIYSAFEHGIGREYRQTLK